jgi:predicted enzyme related to lactoylglutathione lyase
MDSVVYFEMPYEDAKRLSDFYGKVFGWQMNVTGPEMGSYVTAGTTETDMKTMRPIKPGAINGGFYPKSSGAPQEPSVVVAVKNIEEAMKKVTEAGGTLLGQVIDIPGVGKYVSFKDTEGNRLSLLQPKG